MAIFIYLNKFWLKPTDCFLFINGLKPVPIDEIASSLSLLAMTILLIS